jgi:hypothetical protein
MPIKCLKKPFSYALPFVYWQKLVNCATINQLQQKSAKNPMQKLHNSPLTLTKTPQKSATQKSSKNLL